MNMRYTINASLFVLAVSANAASCFKQTAGLAEKNMDTIKNRSQPLKVLTSIICAMISLVTK